MDDPCFSVTLLPRRRDTGCVLTVRTYRNPKRRTAEMIIQLVYWKNVCTGRGRTGVVPASHREPSAKERQAFERVVAKRGGERYIRYS